MPFANRVLTKVAAWLLRLLIASWLQVTLFGIDEHCRHWCTPSACTFISNTSSCEAEATALFNFNFKQELPYLTPCPPSHIRADLFGRIVQPKQYFPFVMLNVSTLVDVQEPTAVLVTFKCLTSYGTSNEFCERPRRPCRLVKWNTKVSRMFTSVECFHVPPTSLMEVNVTARSANCSLRYFVQSPDAAQLQVDSKKFADWLPFIVVDPNADDGIVVNVSRPPSSTWLQGVLVEVWSHREDAPKLHYSKSALFPDDSIRIGNLAAGDYVLRVHVLHPGCPQGRCRYQSLSIQLDRPYPALTRQSHTLVATLTVFGLVAAALLIILYMLRRQRKDYSRPTVVRVNIHRLVKVFLLYSHDSEAYCKVVVALANVLKLDLGCDVLLDEWALRDSEVNPADWLVECMNNANFYLLLFSEGVSLLCNGVTTATDNVLRPWTDVWQAAVRSLCQHALTAKPKDDRTPFICATLSTTPLSILPACLTLPCWFKCRLPEELSTLACHLHGLPEGMLDLSRSEAFQRLLQAISASAQRQLTVSPSSNGVERPLGHFDAWKETGQTVSTLEEEISDTEVDHEEEPQAAFDRYSVTCKVYQLIPPDNAAEAQQRPQKYGLLPPDDSDDEMESFDVLRPPTSSNETTNRLP